MEVKEKGCVYFFKHIGLSPIKIGYSENESPINRFNQFKTYAPFGAELIGFIITEKSKELETKLHNKYYRDRIKGEWFEISKEEVYKIISFYSNLEDIEEMNNFQIAWAEAKLNIDISKTLINNNNNDYFNKLILFINNISKDEKIYNVVLQNKYNKYFKTNRNIKSILIDLDLNGISISKGKDHKGRFLILTQ
jgi:hypothetical protein